jgi:hypothetical protein
MLTSKVATECIYNPKQKPGLKPGAVEALTRRVGERNVLAHVIASLTQIAFLENILLDEAGKVKSQYKYDLTQREDCGSSQNGAHVAKESTVLAHHNNTIVTAPPEPQSPVSTIPREDETSTNTLKRKHEEPISDSWLLAADDIDLAQHLPPQPLISKVVDFFTTSFHHWIPYLHKQRLQDKVSESICSNGLLLVLHALVAVSLRHMDPNVLFLDNDQIRRQSSISRIIVETHAIRSVSVESLQALVFIVFDYVSIESANIDFQLMCTSSTMDRTIAHGH